MKKHSRQTVKQTKIAKVKNPVVRRMAVLFLALCCGFLNACSPGGVTVTPSASTAASASAGITVTATPGVTATQSSSTGTAQPDGTATPGQTSAATAKPTATAAAAGSPNIILILADDLGWTDGTPFGSDFYETPNLTRLRKESMYFTDAHACPLCSPTRASLLTGQYSARTRLTSAIVTDASRPEFVSTYPGMGIPGKTLPSWATASTIPILTPEIYDHLPLEHYTIAEAMRDEGYSTGFYGKWHLGGSTYFPDKQGFQEAVATEGGGPPNGYFGNSSYTTVSDSLASKDITDTVTNNALKFINKHKADSNPFFLEVAEYLVHSPWQALESRVKYYENKLKDSTFQAKYPNNKHTNAIYAAMVEKLDESVGEILDLLDAPGNESLKANTVIVFVSDNGGEITKAGSTQGDIFYNLTSNYPLRGHKHSIYEGGTRVPMLVRWPGKIAANSTCATPVHIVDFYPTFLSLAGETVGSKWKQQTLDGTSLLPLLTGKGTWNREAIYEYHPHYMPIAGTWWSKPACSVRKGDWKLIRFFEGTTELYNLKTDISESKNVASSNAAKVAELNKLLDQWLKDTNALIPTPNPAYGKTYTTLPIPDTSPISGGTYVDSAQTDQFTFTGANWQLGVFKQPGDYGGSLAAVAVEGQYMEFTFTGTQLQILSRRHELAGIIEIIVDGTSVGYVDLYAPAPYIFQAIVYENKNLSSGSHTVRIKCTGAQNAKATKGNLFFDAYIYK